MQFARVYYSKSGSLTDVKGADLYFSDGRPLLVFSWRRNGGRRVPEECIELDPRSCSPRAATAPSTATKASVPPVSVDWGQIFGLSVSPLELIIRGTAMYLFLFLLFRVVVRRRVGAGRHGRHPDPGDHRRRRAERACRANTSRSPTARSWSAPSSSGTWSIDWLNFRVPALRGWLEPPPLLLIRRRPHPAPQPAPRVRHRGGAQVQAARKRRQGVQRGRQSPHGERRHVSVIKR